MDKIREYNYNKDEIIIETKMGSRGTYREYYENKKYFFGLFSKKGNRIYDGIYLHYFRSDDDPTHWRITIKEGVKIKEETWENGKKVSEKFFKKVGLYSRPTKTKINKTKKSGSIEILDGDGNIISKEDWKNGKKVSETLFKWGNDGIVSETFFKNGKEVYKMKFNYSKKRSSRHKGHEYILKRAIVSEEKWKNGKKISETFFDKRPTIEDMIEERTIKNWRNGELVSEEKWKSGNSHGIIKNKKDLILKKVSETLYKNGIPVNKSDNVSDDTGTGIFDSLNKELGSNYKQSDYTIPIDFTEKIDGLVYFEKKLFSGFLTIETFENNKPKKVMEFKKGILKGRFIESYKNGQTKIDCNILNGKIHGENKEYHQNGNLRLVGDYKEGKREGLWKGYYENSQLKIEETYKDDVIHGDYKKYNETGKLIQHVIFVNGHEDTIIKDLIN